jgi:dsRNA-specific ribonuclease
MNIINFTKDIFKNEKIVDEQHMQLLLTSSVSSKFFCKEKNLEGLELIGDKYLQNFFVKNFFSIWPEALFFDSSNCIISKMVIVALSTQELSLICREIGLYKFINYTFEDTDWDELCEDVFEAWVGALTYCYSTESINNFLKIIFEKFSHYFFTFENIHDYKTILNALCAQQKFRIVKHQSSLTNNSNTTNQFESKIGVDFDRRIFGIGYGKNQKESEQFAAKDLLTKIERLWGKEVYNNIYQSLSIWKKWNLYVNKFKMNKRTGQQNEVTYKRRLDFDDDENNKRNCI